ncbi:MAG TPA: histidine kinase dimerization/phospho-acceptor domain-containing protein, partial [Deltaproteobacteria bacterium]|nr:histidine kinase dimerization/phospho-acceptor domain-containing protein [Deltaproteobacteria bacterium]
MPGHAHAPIVVRTALAALLLLVTVMIVFTTWQSTRVLTALAEQSLENTALALSHAAEKALRTPADPGEVRQVLSDRVVAYALIADGDGTILFHTNRRLVGTRLAGGKAAWMRAENPIGERIVLGTGLPAYQYDYPLERAGKTPQMLRLVLHTTSADAIMARAERMWWALGAVLALLWTLGLLFERLSMRSIRLEEKMERQRQLGLIGQMTAVLAHEIRNALGSVKGSVQLVVEKVAAADPVKPALALAIQGTARIETLVNDLLLFSREESYRIETVDLAEVAREAARYALEGWEGTATLDELPQARVVADREKLLRVVVNALKNAREAMSGPGRLDISIAAHGRWTTLTIADTGTGIAAEALARLFEPFFTTKTDGTGLG